MENYLLEANNVSVQFLGFKALEKINLSIIKNEIHCVIGPNGAGKSTLLDVISGNIKPTSGAVYFNKEIELSSLCIKDIVRIGVGRKFQKPLVFAKHTVKQNLEIAIRRDYGVWSSLFQKLKKSEEDKISYLLELLGLADFKNLEAGTLAHGQKQWLCIGMLLAQDPKLLLLDEPVAGMTDKEIFKTSKLIKNLKKTHTILVIEHDMHFVREIADRVTVLHKGEVLAAGSIEQIQKHKKVREVYLGGSYVAH